jgi:hypothetical protein
MRPVIVSGVIANKLHQGGAVWTRLNWILGLRKLGFDTYFVEQIRRNSCIDARGKTTSFEESENLKYFQAITQGFGLEGRASLVYENGAAVVGLSLNELARVARDAVVLINITGHLTLKPIKNLLRCKVYVDLDPGFIQFWKASGCLDAGFDDHDYYFTIGENIGSPSCSIPTAGIQWRTTRQPVVLEEWPRFTTSDRKRFTTVAAWRGPYGAITSNGKRLGLKVHEFRKVLQLPERVNASFEIALDIDANDSADRHALESHGWRIVDAEEAVPDPFSFRRYVQDSAAEFSVAKEMYVATTSGWFSDRTVRYLASGKPALIQDTGLARHFPLGRGLLAFRTLEEAVDGVERISSDYDSHCEAARRIAEEFFDSEKVLGELTGAIGISA